MEMLHSERVIDYTRSPECKRSDVNVIRLNGNNEPSHLFTAEAQGKTNNKQFETAFVFLLYNNVISKQSIFDKVYVFLRTLLKRKKFKKIFRTIVGRTRDICLECTEKHISVAYFLLMESLQGYDEHIEFAKMYVDVDSVINTIQALKLEMNKKGLSRNKIIGALSEAADECVLEYPELADLIRVERLRYSFTGECDIEKIIGRLNDVRNS